MFFFLFNKTGFFPMMSPVRVIKGDISGPLTCCGTCSGSRPRPQCPGGGCTWPWGPGRTSWTSSVGTFACQKKVTRLKFRQIRKRFLVTSTVSLCPVIVKKPKIFKIIVWFAKAKRWLNKLSALCAVLPTNKMLELIEYCTFVDVWGSGIHKLK